MDYLSAIETYPAATPQEIGDKACILDYARSFPHTILTRENRIAHLTSSGFILNPSLTCALMVHHNIYKTWCWTGGHADGDGDLLAVALREAEEETGALGITPLSEEILSLDILPVWGHFRRGEYVSAHLHLSAAYVLIAPEDAVLHVCPDENSGVRWVPVDKLSDYANEPDLVVVYNKLIERARQL